MARIRNIKPEFFLHEGLAELRAETRLLFIGLWTLADRAGRLEDRPRRIKAALCPYDTYDVAEGLSELAAAGFIERYQAEDTALIVVLTFEKHQRCHIKEPASNLPAPCKNGAKPVRAHVKHPASTPESGNLDILKSGERDLENGKGDRGKPNPRAKPKAGTKAQAPPGDFSKSSFPGTGPDPEPGGGGVLPTKEEIAKRLEPEMEKVKRRPADRVEASNQRKAKSGKGEHGGATGGGVVHIGEMLEDREFRGILDRLRKRPPSAEVPH